MHYRIAFEPDLGLSASEFVEAWNKSPFGKEAPAELPQSSAETFLSPEITGILIGAAVGIPVGVVTNFISEILKKKFLEKDAVKATSKITTITIETPAGEPLLVVKREEK